MFYFLEDLKKINLNKFKFIHLLLVICTLRTILNIYGFDVVPFLSSNDEVLIQDPSIYFNKIGEFKALSFYGYLIDKVDSHHPPLFIWSQAKLFNNFGISQYTLRLPAILYSIISLCFISYSLRIVYSIGLTSKFFSNLLTLIIFLDPTYLSWSRFGRNDCLSNLFISGSILFLLLGYKNTIHKYLNSEYLTKKKLIKTSFKFYIPSALLLGLSISTHLQYIFGYIFFIFYMFLIVRHFISYKYIFYILILPPLLSLIIWYLAFKNYLISSFEVLNNIQSKFSGIESFINGLNSIVNEGKFDPQVFFHKGGTLLIFTLNIYFLAILILFIILTKYLINHNFKNLNLIKANFSKVSNQNKKIMKRIIFKNWLYLSIIVVVIHLNLIIFKYGLTTSRFYSFIPISIILLPILINWILKKYKFNFLKIFINLFLLLLLILNSILTYSYFNLVKSRIANPLNNYAILENEVKILSPKIKFGVAAPPNFWLAMHRNLKNKNIHIIDSGFIIESQISKEDRLKNIKKQNIDFIIIKKDSDLIYLLNSTNSGFRQSKDEINIKNANYLVYERNKIDYEK